MIRIVFDPAEQEALQADAREMADGDPQIAYRVTAWEDLGENLGQPPLEDAAPSSG
ncbi:hypothetical protein [Streptomyces sp. NPDC005533]|uniref:hypothetical protein n=1 Tax=Streptomyces sp. NPDC005533 TaxID=3364723 RepID=UPI0036A20E8B